jgi:uncharacterized protein
MQLSLRDRWILANQYRILEKLYPEEAKGFAVAREVLENGYELHYSWITDFLSDGDQMMSAEESKEVLDILDLFSVLKRSYNKLEDKSGIDEWKVQFAGFSGNEETKQMAYTRFFTGLNGGRYTDLDRGDDFNSHFPMLDTYRTMVATWKEKGKLRELTNEDIRHILDAE